VIGINLPNSQKIREEYGSKSIALDNVVEALNRGREEAYGAQVLEEFALPDEWEADSKWVTQADWVELNFHEIIGHGSGKANESLAEDPSFYIKEYYNTLEETRAELLPFISCQMTKQSNLACYQAKMRHGHTTEIMLGVIYNS
jgi:dipeptidyl-peptidase-3